MINATKLEHDLRSGSIKSIIVFERSELKYIEHRFRYAMYDEIGGQVWEYTLVELFSAEVKTKPKYPSKSETKSELIDLDKVIKSVLKYVLLHNFDEHRIRLLIEHEETEFYTLITLLNTLKDISSNFKEYQKMLLVMISELEKISNQIRDLHESSIVVKRNTALITTAVSDLKQLIIEALSQ